MTLLMLEEREDKKSDSYRPGEPVLYCSTLEEDWLPGICEGFISNGSVMRILGEDNRTVYRSLSRVKKNIGIG